MKLIMNVSTPEIKIIPNMLAYCGKLEEALPRLREYGYQGVEFISINPNQLDCFFLDRLLNLNGMKVFAVNTGRIAAELNLTLSDLKPYVREQAIMQTNC